MNELIWSAVSLWLGMNLAVLALIAFSTHRRLSGEQPDTKPDGAQGR